MRNILLQLSYNGSAYHGYQVQQNALSVAEVLQNALERVLGVREDIIGCSRTDSGVHALCYYVNFRTKNRIPCKRLVPALNGVLPGDIAVHLAVPVPDGFHARYAAEKKSYLYKIWNAPVKNPMLHRQALHYPRLLNVEMLQDACSHFIGTHDFKAFCASGGKEMETVRTIYDCDIRRSGEHLVEFTVTGSGFLYHMVRIMVGTLLEINEGRIQKETLPRIIAGKDRDRAGRTARPDGLYLCHVEYGGKWFEQKSDKEVL